jgi:predicted O-methyltransferase YrrM
MNGPENTGSTLHDPAVVATLARLRGEARGDWYRGLRFLPAVLWAMLSGKGLMKVLSPAKMSRMYIPVSRGGGELLYTLARAGRARTIVEFGSSFGISTLYLAAAARDNAGIVLTTEIEPAKCRATEANLREAGLDAWVRVLEGDARESLREFDAPIDLLFLDGWKDLYLPLIEQLRPQLAPAALIIADNIDFRDARPYVEHVRAPHNGFVSTTLGGHAMEVSVFTGAGRRALSPG